MRKNHRQDRVVRIIAIVVMCITMAVASSAVVNVTAHGTEPGTDSTETAISESSAADTTTEYSDKSDDLVQYEEDKFHIDQAEAYMPYINIYLYADEDVAEDIEQSINQGQIRVTLDGDEIEVADNSVMNSEDISTNYYVLLDTSTSINLQYFEAAKEAIKNIDDEIGDSDNIYVYTVGGDSQEDEDMGNIYSSDSSKESLDSCIESVHCDKDWTYLNVAFDEVADSIKDGRTETISGQRNVILLFSDGCDDSGIVPPDFEGTLEDIKESGAVMYFFEDEDASLYGDGPKEKCKKLKDWINDSKPASDYFECSSDDLIDKVEEVLNKQNCIYMLTADASTNIRDDDEHILSVSVKGIDTEDEYTLYYDEKYKRDDDAPKLEAGYPQYVSEKTIKIRFTEKVISSDTGGDITKDNIIIRNNDNDSVEVDIVSQTDEENTYIVETGDTLYVGDYSLELSNVTDASAEKNPAESGPYSFTSEGPEYTEPEPVQVKSFIDTYWWILIPVFVAIVALAAFIVYRIIRKHKGVVVIDDKATLVSNADVKHHIVLENDEKGQPVTLYVSASGRQMKTIRTSVNGSMIIGRSDLCDVYIDDPMMSRQHFAIEYDGESFYIQDLNTTNGTSLNGVRLKHKRRLENGDQITAGSLDIMIRW